ncbi:MAG: hypothetical protein K2X47_04520 [Bdellovibrionales bacterium]|nr:hypothetical protein [Bdellovibrionales bacterium]
MKAQEFFLFAVLLLSSSVFAQEVPPVVDPTPAVRRQFCLETLMYFNIPTAENPLVATCEKATVSKIHTRARPKSPEFPLEIEGTVPLGKSIYICQGVVRPNTRVVLKNCIELTLF